MILPFVCPCVASLQLQLMLLRELVTSHTIYLDCIYNRLISATATDNLLIFLRQLLTCGIPLGSSSRCQTHTAAAQQMESAIMRLAKEIRSRDQGYTQQGVDWFTVQAVSYSIWSCCESWQWLKQIHLALNRIVPLLESN